MTQLFIVDTAIVEVGPFIVDDMTGDLHGPNATISKDVLNSMSGWRIADIPDDQMPEDFAIGKYTVDAQNAFVAATPLPLPPDVLADAQDQKWEEIKAERDRRVVEGGYTTGGHWYASDLVSRSQQLGLARLADQAQAAGADMTAQMTISGQPVYWKTMDDGFVAMTPDLAHAILAAAEIQDAAHFAAANVHKAAMMALTDPTNYDFSGGWPAIYEGA